jgi:pimeloyl-ACP methyl ester carboxylesterase
MTDASLGGPMGPWAAWDTDASSVPNAFTEYMIDAVQRTILFWDVMRQRGNQYFEHLQQKAPNVLSFRGELIADGRTLPRPVNYGMVRIVPPDGVVIDPQKRPFVVIDPRAGHGPGIGGFKADSEIGVAMRAGHPCYLVGFLPEPVPGQTIEDVAEAEARFLEIVIERHPKAEGKPAVIGNCQGGWAVMLVAAVRPELFGPIILAGAPASYWAGVRGANPMRYAGGMLGGSWLAALTSDLGAGKFDGAWLVQNFENLNPANTLWTKQYNLYSKIDTEGPRYLGFEKYWGGHVLLNAEEIQFIVDKLFIGNKLSSSEIATRGGVRIDLRNIRSPIVVFCSKGDNITPPPQALGWILDLYDSVDDIRVHGQTIVYAVHESIGHLGIFVSGGVAQKEHAEFASNIDLIDVLPPGLYEAVLERKAPDDPIAALTGGDYIARFEPRTLGDIRALGGNDAEDDRRFATVARVSEVNHGLYRTFASPTVRAATNDALAYAMRRLHPLRLPYELWSDRNPLARFVERAADQVRAHRKVAAADNPFLVWQSRLSEQIIAALDAYRDARDRITEAMFLGIYGAPFVQALAGVSGSDGPVRHRPGRDAFNKAFVEREVERLKRRMAKGGLGEALIRAMIYVGRLEGADERAFAVIRQIRAEHGDRMRLEQFKSILREQFFMLLIDEERALATIPELARRDAARIDEGLGMLRRVLTARGPVDGERAERLRRVEAILRSAGTEALPGTDAVPSAAPSKPAPKRASSTGRSKRGNGRAAASTA